jgi:ADP-ribose pyrophosphatase YjhB (NUDIX family)
MGTTVTAMRTAGIWIEQGHVLLESLADRDLWGIPGGRLEPEESAAEGCLREYREEIGLEMEVLGLALLHENFWEEEGTRNREYGFYFWVRPTDLSRRAIAPVRSREPRLKFAWFRLEELETLAFVPAAVKVLLPQLGSQTLFASTRETT